MEQNQLLYKYLLEILDEDMMFLYLDLTQVLTVH
jgi:hypothetical protein